MTTCLQLLWPILFGLLFLGLGTVCLFSQKISDKLDNIPLVGGLDRVIEIVMKITQLFCPDADMTNVIIKNRFVKVAFLCLFAACFLIWPLFRDYTSFFPTNLKLVARFDDPGIVKSLNDIGEAELAKKGININPDWKKLKEGYLATLNREIRDKFKGTGFTFSESTCGEGNAFIKTTKTSKWLTYEITEGYGKIFWHYDRDRFDTEFNLKYKSIVKLTPKDVYFNWGSIIIPEYDQVIYINPTQAKIHHKIIAATKVTMFPFTDVSNSLYLYHGKGQKDWVPIGYAQYSF